MARTFFEKLWDDHVIADLGENNYLLNIDRLVLHDMSGSRALLKLEKSGRQPARPELVFVTVDHYIKTDPGRGPTTYKNEDGGRAIEATRRTVAKAGLHFFDVGDPRQGITHVTATEHAIALPGLTMVCGDSHTCTLGGIGALAWGIGHSEGEHVLATQALIQAKPQTMLVEFTGRLRPGVEAKDLILHLIGSIGAQGGIGYAAEFGGEAIRAMPVEGRLTLCNMAIEFSAKYGFVAPDESVYDYLAGREFAPKGTAWDRAVEYWRTLPSDPGASYDKVVTLDASAIAPQVTWGISPSQVVGIDGRVPDPQRESDGAVRQAMERALDYMDLAPGAAMDELPIQAAYIGSCTNARLSDLQVAAAVLRGRKVAEGVQAICVPGSTAVKLAAEAEGLDLVFKDAGFEWHEAACGICGGMSNPRLARLRVVSTTNRNFENRQGIGTRTHLASPATVAASAVAGHLADARLLEH